jgi:ABC-type transport system substrate-binding protein
MLDAARAEPDLAARIALYGKAQAMLWEEGGVLIPYHKVFLRALSARVTGLDGVLGGDLPWWNIGLQ